MLESGACCAHEGRVIRRSAVHASSIGRNVAKLEQNVCSVTCYGERHVPQTPDRAHLGSLATMPAVDTGKIIVRGAREHNLQNINVELPRDKLIVFTGLSGSGKSSLAFDTIYAEGQRRYVESLSAYARQFLGQMDKPDVDMIEGLSPAISIDQKSASRNPRSTVGTITEIYDYLRLLYARIGVQHCPNDGTRLQRQTPQQIVDRILLLPDGTRFQVLAPVVRGRKGDYDTLLEDLAGQGYVRARVDGEVVDIAEFLKRDERLARYEQHKIEIIIDRLVRRDGIERRLTDSLETALKLADGVAEVELMPADGSETETLTFSQHLACPKCGTSYDEPAPRNFSFNSPYGACEACDGLGTTFEVDPELVIPDTDLSINDGAIAPWRTSHTQYFTRMLEAVAEVYGIDLDAPYRTLNAKQQKVVLHGVEGNLKVKYKNRYGRTREYSTAYEGVIPWLNRRREGAESDWAREQYEGYMREVPCTVVRWRTAEAGHACRHRQRQEHRRGLRHGDRRVGQVPRRARAQRARSPDRRARHEGDQRPPRLPARRRPRLPHPVAISRHAGRRRGATHPPGQPDRLGSGRHAVRARRAVDRSAPARQPPADRHAAAPARPRQHGAGRRARRRDHSRGRLDRRHRSRCRRARRRRGVQRSGEGHHEGQGVDHRSVPVGQEVDPGAAAATPAGPRVARGQGAREHNLRNIDVRIPLGCFVAVTGVSGSGKSTLVRDILLPVLMQRIYKSKHAAGKHKTISGIDLLDKVIDMDQSPIGRTPRSNPATYTGVFDNIRKLFATTAESKVRGYMPGRFSFNVQGGRCEACSGDGTIKIEMHFLPDVYVPCEVCKGARYNRDTLDIAFKGKNIAEVLDMPVAEAVDFFANQPAIGRHMQTLLDVGLGYVRLGQSAPTLSGGEAQRVKLASELAKRSTGHTIYLLDEPTTGLHFDDVRRLLTVLSRLVDQGNTVLVIEHNLDVIKTADWIIDLGPEGGSGGGLVVAEGSPEDVAAVDASHTGRFLRPLLL